MDRRERTLKEAAMTDERLSLFYKEGGSDKFYFISIEPQGGGFVVPFTFGRRGTTGQSGTKTPNGPVPYEKAKKLFDSIMNEKMAKGYSPGEGMKPYAGTPGEKKATGINCQLLNPVEEREAERLIRHLDFVAQEKFDGRRMLIRWHDGAATGINRKGLECGFPAPLEADAREIGRRAARFVIDGEAVGDKLHAFDILSLDGDDLREKPYLERLGVLTGLFAGRRSIVVVKTAHAPKDKQALFDSVRRAGGEGVVFKDMHAPYKAGRPASGGCQLKFKFVSTLSAIVARVNARRSVALELLDGKKRLAVGNVTIPPNAAIPKAGDILEVRYLYYNAGGSLYQPVYLAVREDLSAEDCVAAQLKHRASQEDDDA
jgi:bifunctional non-homologous end joining protein LigD